MASCGFVSSHLKGPGSISDPSVPSFEKKGHFSPRATSAANLRFAREGDEAGDAHVPHVLAHRYVGHTDTVLACLVVRSQTADQQGRNILFTCSSDSNICAWDIHVSQLIVTLRGHTRAVLALGVNERLNVLISASKDNDLRVWDLRSLTCLAVVTGRIGCILALKSVGAALFCGGQDSILSVLNLSLAIPSPSPASAAASDLSSPRSAPRHSKDQPRKVQWKDLEVCSLHQHHGTIQAIAATATLVFTASDDHDIAVWRLTPLQCIKRLHKHTAGVACLAIDESCLYSGSHDTTIHVWDLDSLLLIRSLTRHTGSVLSVDASALRFFSSLSSDYSAIIWSKDTFQCVAQVQFATLQVCLAFSVDLAARHHFELYTGGICSGVYRWQFPLAAHHQAKATSCKSTPCLSVRLDYSNEWLLSTLKNFVAFRSISQDPTCSSESWSCAKFLRRLLEETGFESRLCTGDLDINPVVLARYVPPNLPRDQEYPTLLFVGHYDVVPVGPPEQWINHDPFTLHGEGGYLYARGVTDNKGPVMAFVAAARELIASGELCASLIMVVEGEEETGSRGFRDVVRDNLDWLGSTTHILVSNNYWINDDSPCLTYGMRGVIKMRLTVDGPPENLHSGVHGGSVQEPMVDLIRVLNNLVTSDGQILIPDFTDDVRSVSQAESELLDATYQAFEDTSSMGLPTSQAISRSSITNAKRDMDSRQLLFRRWQWPAVSIHSISSSVQGEELSVIPRRVSALVTIRTVPDQAPEKLVKLFCKHVRSCFKMNLSPNNLDITHLSSGDWWLGTPSSPFFAAAHSAIQKIWGVAPLYVREGGTLATTRFLEETLKASALHLPLGQASDSAHMINERLRILNLFNGRAIMKELILSIAPTSADATSSTT